MLKLTNSNERNSERSSTSYRPTKRLWKKHDSLLFWVHSPKTGITICNSVILNSLNFEVNFEVDIDG